MIGASYQNTVSGSYQFAQPNFGHKIRFQNSTLSGMILIEG